MKYLFIIAGLACILILLLSNYNYNKKDLKIGDFVKVKTTDYLNASIAKIQNLGKDNWVGIVEGDMAMNFKYDQIEKVLKGYENNCFDPRSPLCPSSPIYKN